VPQGPRERPSRKKPSPPLSPDQVARIIRAALGPEGYVIPSRHLEIRTRQRDFTIQDALAVLERGTLAARATWNNQVGSWNYDVHGTDLEGDSLTVRIAVLDPLSVILVTAF
jgi:hypothetical protein